ncbi:hypothetical protein ACH5RR_037744 [Cinchona calisaya]|uniref:B box-type domain-containing protein n=1 Tax=Cinchona calisaya TaxID=153742 RepID=A0ABD2YAR3_9GENT
MGKGSSCELCSKAAARMYCDSDEARLCRDCDEKVHSANFLVAKHSRTLLCHVCQSPTLWKASGISLGSTISVCEKCTTTSNHSSHHRQKPSTMRLSTRSHGYDQDDETTESVDDDDHEEYSDSDDEEEEGEINDDEEDGENQVVPWSSSNCLPSSSSTAPLTTSSSSSQHGSFFTRDGGASLKRCRDNLNLHLDSDDEDVCCSSQVNLDTGEMENSSRRASFRSIKMARAEEELIQKPESNIELVDEKEKNGTIGFVHEFSANDDCRW